MPHFLLEHFKAALKERPLEGGTELKSLKKECQSDWIKLTNKIESLEKSYSIQKNEWETKLNDCRIEKLGRR